MYKPDAALCCRASVSSLETPGAPQPTHQMGTPAHTLNRGSSREQQRASQVPFCRVYGASSPFLPMVLR